MSNIKDTKIDEEARKAKNAYQREWRRKNPEKNREYMIRYWCRKAAENGKE